MVDANSKFGINTYSYTMTHTASECVKHLLSAGYRDFELMMYPGHLWPAHFDVHARHKLRDLVSASGARITTLNMPNIDLNITGASEEVRKYTLDILRGVVVLAGDLNAPGVVIGPGKANPLFPMSKEQLLDYLIAGLRILEPLAKSVGTSLYVENMPFAFLPDSQSIVEALNAYGSADIGMVYDVANAHFISEDFSEGLAVARDRVKVVHLSDTNRKTYNHAAVGVGDVDFGKAAHALNAIGFSEKPILEIIATRADEDIRKSAELLQRYKWPHR